MDKQQCAENSYIGNPCRKCRNPIRYKSNRSCIDCMKKAANAQLRRPSLSTRRKTTHTPDPAPAFVEAIPVSTAGQVRLRNRVNEIVRMGDLMTVDQIAEDLDVDKAQVEAWLASPFAKGGCQHAST